VIHYHGTPITPRRELEKMAGRHFCVSFAHPQDADWCLENGQSVMWDNGAFSAFTKGKDFDVFGYEKWVEPKLFHPHWAVIPDVIGGGIEEQRNLLSQWMFSKELSAPVWHIHLPVDWLLELCDNYPRVCFGSSGKFWKIGTDEWVRRLDLGFNALQKRNMKNWIHMLRAMSAASKGYWPFASADSTNVARNFKNKGYEKCPEQMARTIDAKQPKHDWEIKAEEQTEFNF